MPHYKDTNNNVHWLDSAEHEAILPPGSVQISYAEADALRYREPTKEEINAPILAQLAEIDKKTIRPLREGDSARVAALDAEAAELRKLLVK